MRSNDNIFRYLVLDVCYTYIPTCILLYRYPHSPNPHHPRRIEFDKGSTIEVMHFLLGDKCLCADKVGYWQNSCSYSWQFLCYSVEHINTHPIFAFTMYDSSEQKRERKKWTNIACMVFNKFSIAWQELIPAAIYKMYALLDNNPRYGWRRKIPPSSATLVCDATNFVHTICAAAAARYLSGSDWARETKKNFTSILFFDSLRSFFRRHF